MNSTQTLRNEIKQLIVQELKLPGRDPASIGDEQLLFGEGLSLDSLDALTIVNFVEINYKVQIPDGPDGRKILATVASLAAFIEERGGWPKGE